MTFDRQRWILLSGERDFREIASEMHPSMSEYSADVSAAQVRVLTFSKTDRKGLFWDWEMDRRRDHVPNDQFKIN